MKIGIYSDAHFSISSSILSRVNGYKYSARLDSLIDSFKWMYDTFKKNNVELIVNGGDLTDSDLLHAEENSALYEALSCNPGIPELYILGNHEIKDKNSTISSVSILKGYSNIEIYNDITEWISIANEVSLILVPFLVDKERYNEVYDKILKSESKNVYLFSHMSYIGENYNNYIETEGLDKIHLTTAFPNLKGIYNGHIHNSKDDGLYHQIGSLTGQSFGDNYDGGLPGIIILDTDTGEFTRIPNPYAVLFYKLNASSVNKLGSSIKKLGNDNYKCLRIEVPASIKDEVGEYLEQNIDKFKIKEYRLKAKYELNKIKNTELVESFRTYNSPYDALRKFTETLDETPYPQEDMMKFLNTYIGG